RLVFLSACHSGDILRVRDWQEFLAVARGKEPESKESPPADAKDLPVAERPGYTGTAHALLRGGVPSVVAMRYAVGDDYARGLGGMGKTALAAEALALWQRRFEWVLIYQAKPNALGLDATLRDVHLRLSGELGRYHGHVQAHPADAVYRAADAEFTGPERLDRLTRNLVRALGDEAILLV